MLLSDRKMLNT